MSDYIVNPIKKILSIRIYLPKKLVIFRGAPVKKDTLYFEKENISFMEEKKNREGKGRQYLEEENIFFEGSREGGKGGIYYEKENIYFWGGEEKRRRKGKKIYLSLQRKRNTGKENIFFAEALEVSNRVLERLAPRDDYLQEAGPSG